MPELNALSPEAAVIGCDLRRLEASPLRLFVTVIVNFVLLNPRNLKEFCYIGSANPERWLLWSLIQLYLPAQDLLG